MKKFLLSLFAVAFSFGLSAQTNLLENGDFETWADGVPTNWQTTTKAGNATLAQSTDAHAGSYSCEVAYVTGNNKRLGYKETSLTAGTYTFSFYAKGGQCRPGYVPVTDGKVGSYVYGDYATLSSSEWTKVEYTFTLDATTTVALVIMNPKSNDKTSYTATTLYIDDAVLTTEDGGSTGDPGTGESIANTEATAYTVAKAHELIAAGEDLDTEVYVKGIVTKVTGFNTSIGSITYYLGDTEADENPLQIYGGLYYNGDKFSSKDDLQVGDEIVVKGKLKSYNGTDEMDKNNVVITHKRDGKDVTPTGPTKDITNTPETAYSVADAIKLIDDGEGLTTMVYVKGYIVGTPSIDVTQYYNATYKISDVKGNEETTLTVFRGKYLNNEKFSSEDQLATGDEVVVYGNLTLYGSTYEMNSGNYLYSINGKTTSISSIEESNVENAPIYNIAGQRVSGTAKGLLIQGGKKFISK